LPEVRRAGEHPPSGANVTVSTGADAFALPRIGVSPGLTPESQLAAALAWQRLAA